MITCHSIQRIADLDFTDYLNLPQYSHSYLKSETGGLIYHKKFSTKMQIGSLVDAIRTGGTADMSHELYPIAKDIAARLHAEFGWAFNKLEKQISYTGIMQYDAGKAKFEIPVKGRPDFEYKKSFLIDLKVTDEINVDAIIKHFGYGNQQFCYGKLAECKTAYLLFYRKKKRDTVLKRIEIGNINTFWQEKIIKFGKAI